MNEVQLFIKEFKNSYIQTFDDTKSGKFIPMNFPMSEFGKYKDQIIRDNNNGLGVYFTPNSCLGGRKEENVNEIKWVYCDMDRWEKLPNGLKVDHGDKDIMKYKIENSPIQPDIVVESKNGFHLYWKINGECNRTEFGIIIKGIIQHFDSDKAISSTNEVLRLPPFLHCKDLDDKFKVSIRHIDIKSHSVTKLMSSFPYIEPIQESLNRHNIIDNEEIDLIKKISIVDVLRKLGVQLSNKNFILESGKETSASVNITENYINRFSGKPGSGTTIDAVMEYGKMDKSKAIQWLKDFIGLKKEVKLEHFVKKSNQKDQIDDIFKPYTWGTQGLDKVITPIQKHHYIIFAGETGSGKTGFCFDMAIKNAKLGHKVCFMSLEMSAEDMYTRIAREYAQISKSEWRNKGTIEPFKVKKYKDKKKDLENIPNLTVLGFSNQNQIYPTTKNIGSLILEGNFDLVFIDNFDKVTSEKNSEIINREIEISDFFLKFTNTHKIPCIIVHHFNKGTDKGNNQRGINSLKGSSKIGHDTDTVVIGSRMSIEDQVTNEDKARFTISQKKDRDFGILGTQEVFFNKGTFDDTYLGSFL